MQCFVFGRVYWDKLQGRRRAAKRMWMSGVRVQVVSEWLAVSSTVGSLFELSLGFSFGFSIAFPFPSTMSLLSQ